MHDLSKIQHFGFQFQVRILYTSIRPTKFDQGIKQKYLCADFHADQRKKIGYETSVIQDIDPG